MVAREGLAGVAFRGVGTGRFVGEAARGPFDRVPEDILIESKVNGVENHQAPFGLGLVVVF